MNPATRWLSGGCLCGAVQYSVQDEFEYALNCHCSQCRRATGAAFKSFAGIERTKLHITKGRDQLLIFGESTAHDIRCKRWLHGTRSLTIFRSILSLVEHQ